MSAAFDEFSSHYGFDFDTFQTDAFDQFSAGNDVVVSAPTGSGKTVVAEYALDRCLRQGRRSFYTTPMKALSNQKFNDLGRRFGVDRVGLLTGDRSVRSDAEIVVMTTEVLRNMIYAGDRFVDLGVVVIDEVHFLQDSYRGPVWEEVIIQLPPAVQLVCLSATVSNSTELADWMTTIRRPTTAIVEHHRPVPLTAEYLIGDRSTGELAHFDVLVGTKPNPAVGRFVSQRTYRTRPGAEGGRGRGTQRRSTRRATQHQGRQHGRRGERSDLASPDRLAVLRYLQRRKLLPAVHFIFSRRQCADAAAACMRSGVRVVSREEGERAVALAEQRLHGFSDADLRAVGYAEFLEQLRCGVAAHHAGMIPAFREIVERCFLDGLVRLVYATETLAVGVNMPARSVVIDKLSKFNGVGHEMLSPAQYTQLAGRAGRRGIDSSGTVVVLWTPYVEFDVVARLSSSDAFDLRSAFRPTYNMAANLMIRYDRVNAQRFLGLSFAQFQADRSVVRLERTIANLRQERDELLAAAASPYGDIHEYYDRARKQQGVGYDKAEAHRSRQHDGEVDSPIAEALRGLAPGDVVPVDVGTFKGPAAVVATGSRAGGIHTTVVTATGRRYKIRQDEWTYLPVPIARVVLPGTYSPHQKDYRSKVAERIKAATQRVVTSDNDVAGPGSDEKPTLSQRVPLRAARSATDGVGSNARSASQQRHSSTADHPVTADPNLVDRLSALASAEKVEAKIERLSGRLERRDGALARAFDRVLGVLESFGFVDTAAWELTPSGVMLTRVFHENDLLICRAIESGLMDELDPADLAGLVSSFVYEHRSPDDPPVSRFTSDDLERRWRRLQALDRQQSDTERKFQQVVHREPDATMFTTAHGWVAGGELADVLDDHITGGDFVRSMRQLADVLEQVAIVSPLESTRRSARRAVSGVYREIVADLQTSGLAHSPASGDEAMRWGSGDDPKG